MPLHVVKTSVTSLPPPFQRAVAAGSQQRHLAECSASPACRDSSSQAEVRLPPAAQRAALAAATWALTALLAAPPALAEPLPPAAAVASVAATKVVAAAEAGAVADAAASGDAAAASREAIMPVYFGNGCFWGRQYDFANTEKALGRGMPEMSAVVGYAGGKVESPAGKVCYYRGPSGSVYEELGHAEVVQVELRGGMDEAKKQYAAFADTYFKQFRKTPFGMMRLDPQDAGPGYRNVIGLPGGVDSPFFPILQAANVNGMRLLPGNGNIYDSSGQPAEGDEFNTVWVVDSNKLAFNRAETYHQFHNGIGKAFPKSYTQDLKQAMKASGKIDPTGCPEYFFN